MTFMSSIELQDCKYVIPVMFVHTCRKVKLVRYTQYPVNVIKLNVLSYTLVQYYDML